MSVALITLDGKTLPAYIKTATEIIARLHTLARNTSTPKSSHESWVSLGSLSDWARAFRMRPSVFRKTISPLVARGVVEEMTGNKHKDFAYYALNYDKLLKGLECIDAQPSLTKYEP